MKHWMDSYRKVKGYTLHQTWDVSTTVSAKEKTPLTARFVGECHLSLWSALAIGITVCAALAGAWISK